MLSRRRRADRRLLLAVAATLAVAGLSVAPDARGQPRGAVNLADASPTLANVTTDGVFVRDSATAGDKLALAERMERAKEWDTSADVYQEVLDRYGDRLVPTHTDAAGRPDRFGSVTSVVQDKLAAWPPEGLEVYTARHGSIARQMLEADPEDRTTLANVVSRYFVTDAGRDAAVRLVEQSFDDAEFTFAATLAERLIARHPTLDAAPEADAAEGAPPLRAAMLMRAALAWHLAGESSRAATNARALAERFPDVRATLGGVDRGLAAFVTDAIAQPAPRPTLRLAADRWPQPFGTNDRAAALSEASAPNPDGPKDAAAQDSAAAQAGSTAQASSSAQASGTREWARILSFPVGRPQANDRGLSNLRDQGAATGILPAVDRGLLYFQDNASIVARDLQTGEPPVAWQRAHPTAEGAFRLPGATATPVGAQMGVTLAGDRVLAILGQSDWRTRNMAMVNGINLQRRRGMPGNRPAAPAELNGARLVCLDRETGRLVWQASPAGTVKADGNGEPGGRADEGEGADKDAAAPPARAARPDAGLADAPGANAAADPNAGANAARPDPDEVAIRASEPIGSPIVVNDNVYVVTRGLRGGGFLDVYLACFSLGDGELRWARHLASGNVAAGFDEDGRSRRDGASSHLAYADGRLFVSTDLGALAAVDAADGTIAWLSFYPRPKPPAVNRFGGMPQQMNRPTPAFAGNPLVVRDGRVVSMPVDAEAIFVHDAATGRCAVQMPTRRQLDANRHERIDVLAGLAGDRLVTATESAIIVLSWSKLLGTAAAQPDAAAAGDAAAGNVAAGEPPARVVSVADALINRYLILSPEHKADRSILGRPFVTEQSIYVPVAWRLLRFDANARRVLDQYPADDEPLNVRPEEAAGNLLAVDGMLIVASPDRVNVYAELAQLRRRLDEAIARAPGEVAPRLTYARAMFDTGRLDETMRWLDEAIAQLAAGRGDASSSASLRPGPDRDAVFSACLAMLRRTIARPAADVGIAPNTPGLNPIAAAAVNSEHSAFAAQVVARMERVADSVGQRVTARLATAWQAGRRADVAGAIAAYQSMLEEDAFATASVAPEEAADAAVLADANPPFDDFPDFVAGNGINPGVAMPDAAANAAGPGGGVPVTRLARAAIDRLLRTDPDGRGAYAPIEARAAAALDAERQRLGLAAPAEPATTTTTNADNSAPDGAPSGPASSAPRRATTAPTVDLGGLLAIAERFPNSDAARRALGLAVERVVAGGATAADVRRLGGRLDDADPKLRGVLNQALFRMAIAAGDIDAALGRARRIAQTDPAAPLAAADGPALPAAERVAQLQAESFARAERRLPDLHADYAAGHAFADAKGVTVPDIAAILVPATPDVARNDRLVAIVRSASAERKIRIYAAGETSPLCEVVVPGLIDSAQAMWTPAGDRLVLAQPGRVVGIDAAAGKVLWTRESQALANESGDLATNGPAGGDSRPDDRGGGGRQQLVVVPAALLTTPGAAAGGEDELVRAARRAREQVAAAGDAQAAARALQQQRMVQQQLLMRNGNARVNAMPDPVVDVATAEAFGEAGIAGGRVVVTTSRGRVIGLDAETGATAWQRRPGDRPFASVAIGAGHVAVATTDERASRAVAYDAADGREVVREQYTPDLIGRIANLAISPEGWLAIVRGDTVGTWDLGDGGAAAIADAGRALAAGDGPGAAGNFGGVAGGAPFALSRRPEHVAFSGDKLLVLADVNAQTMHVRILDALTGQPARAGDSKTGQQVQRRIPLPFPRDRRPVEPQQASIRTHAGRAILSTGIAMSSVPILNETPGSDGDAAADRREAIEAQAKVAQATWERTLGNRPGVLSPQSPMLVRDGVLIVAWPADLVGQSTAASVTVELYTRERLPDGREVGMVADEFRLGDPGEPARRNGRRTSTGPRILDRFAPVDGGLYLLSNSGTLTFLKGAK